MAIEPARPAKLQLADVIAHAVGPAWWDANIPRGSVRFSGGINPFAFGDRAASGSRPRPWDAVAPNPRPTPTGIPFAALANVHLGTIPALDEVATTFEGDGEAPIRQAPALVDDIDICPSWPWPPIRRPHPGLRRRQTR